MMHRKKIIVGSRKSILALQQSKIVIKKLSSLFGKYNFKIKGIVTSGDRLKTWPKAQIKGLFVKEIEEALLKGQIDFAVHSMKDLPVKMHKDLEIAAVMKRVEHRDVLISSNGTNLFELKKGSRIGTSSPRRKMQIYLVRPDLKVGDIRGNLDTRINKLKRGDFDAIIVAGAGLQRMGWERLATEYLNDDIMLPAPAQGALGIQIRKNDRFLRSIVRKINSSKTKTEIEAEREFLNAMGGGCRVPIGALARISADKLSLRAVVVKSKRVFCKASVKTSKKSAKKAGKLLARKVKILLSKKSTKR